MGYNPKNEGNVGSHGRGIETTRDGWRLNGNFRAITQSPSKDGAIGALDPWESAERHSQRFQVRGQRLGWVKHLETLVNPNINSKYLGKRHDNSRDPKSFQRFC